MNHQISRQVVSIGFREAYRSVCTCDWVSGVSLSQYRCADETLEHLWEVRAELPWRTVPAMK